MFCISVCTSILYITAVASGRNVWQWKQRAKNKNCVECKFIGSAFHIQQVRVAQIFMKLLAFSTTRILVTVRTGSCYSISCIARLGPPLRHTKRKLYTWKHCWFTSLTQRLQSHNRKFSTIFLYYSGLWNLLTAFQILIFVAAIMVLICF